MESIVKDAAHLVALLAESAAVLIILLGIVKSAIYYIQSPLPMKFHPELIAKLRMQLGCALSLSLEFLIGADILKTAIAPTWNELGMLGAIVVIRTVLNYFLTQEINVEIARQRKH